MNHDNKFIIVSKMPEGQPGFLLLQQGVPNEPIGICQLLETNIAEANEAANEIYLEYK